MNRGRKRQLERSKLYVRPEAVPSSSEPILLVHFLNGRKTLSGDNERETDKLNADCRERIYALLEGFIDVAKDLEGTLPASYPREGPLSLAADRVLARIEAEREGKPLQTNWPRKRGRATGYLASGVAVCWSNINALLADYPVIKQVRQLAIVKKKHARLEDLLPSDVTTGWGVEEEHLGMRPSLEGRIVEEIIRLAQIGHLSRLRLCCCGEWFYAHRAQHTAHSPKCRQKKYSQMEETKAHRRLYSRWYYAMNQSPNSPRKKLTFEQWLRKIGPKKLL